jgi:hypothetical protein
MLEATEEETWSVIEYFEWQAPDLKVEFVQKVYEEHVLGHRHDVWDIHTNKDRWWVITNPTNLYSQEQFPNMDLAITFHVGLCIRIPRSEKKKLSELPIEPFAECYRYLTEASEALTHADEISDFQSMGIRCREALLAFVSAAQSAVPWISSEPAPKKADLRAWAAHICGAILQGDTHKDRRHLFKTLLESAWGFANWLAHAKSSSWYDAEAASETTGNAIGLCTSMVIRYIRGVPDSCPACGSHRLSPERGIRTDMPEIEWERSTCQKCGWVGDPVQIEKVPAGSDDSAKSTPVGECVIPTVPLRTIKKPS